MGSRFSEPLDPDLHLVGGHGAWKDQRRSGLGIGGAVVEGRFRSFAVGEGPLDHHVGGEPIDQQVKDYRANTEQEQTLLDTELVRLAQMNKMKDSDILNEDNRERIVDTFINSIYVYDDKVVINYNCQEDSETILPDNLGESSYLRIVGEPESCSFCYGSFLYI